MILLEALDTAQDIAIVCHGILYLCDESVSNLLETKTKEIDSKFHTSYTDSVKYKNFVQEYFLNIYSTLLEEVNAGEQLFQFLANDTSTRSSYFAQGTVDFSFFSRMETETIQDLKKTILQLCTLLFQFKLSSPKISLVFETLRSFEFNPTIHQFVLQGRGQRFKFVVVPGLSCGEKSVEVKAKVTN